MRNTKRELNDIRFEFQPTKVNYFFRFILFLYLIEKWSVSILFFRFLYVNVKTLIDENNWKCTRALISSKKLLKKIFAFWGLLRIFSKTQGYGSTLMWLRIWIFTLMRSRIRILLLVKLMRICDHWSTDHLCRGVPRILPGGMHIFGWPTPHPPHPHLDPDPDPHQDFELDPDPHQINADPQPWAQLSKDCCLIYNYV
jgi:hypothetical protein